METLGLTEAAYWEVALTELTPTFDLHRQFFRSLRGLVTRCQPQMLGTVLGALIALMSPIYQPLILHGLPEAIAATTTTTNGCTAVLRRGDRGNAVTQLQQALAQRKYNISVDGIFGEQTEVILKLFQRSSQLTVDGIYGPQTCNALARTTTTNATNTTATKPTTTKPTTTQPSTTQPTTAANANTTETYVASNRDGVLRRGEQGDDVLRLQQQLRNIGYNTVDLSGKFDWATETAVREFQRSKGLTVDGSVNATTQASLDRQAIAPRPVTPPATPTNTSPTTASNPTPNLPTSYPYIVAIPAASNTTLTEVQRFIPKAQLQNSRLGLYVHAGSYQNRHYAESISYNLRSRGLDARVISQ